MNVSFNGRNLLMALLFGIKRMAVQSLLSAYSRILLPASEQINLYSNLTIYCDID